MKTKIIALFILLISFNSCCTCQESDWFKVVSEPSSDKPYFVGNSALSVTFPSASTSKSTAYPSNVKSGDILFLLVSCGESNNYNSLSGWTQLRDVTASNLSYGMYYKTATGSESGTVTVTSSMAVFHASYMVNCRNFSSATFYNAAQTGSGTSQGFANDNELNSTTVVMFIKKNSETSALTGVNWNERFDSGLAGWSGMVAEYQYGNGSSFHTGTFSWSTSAYYTWEAIFMSAN